jgi:hypothetical protein
MCAPSWFATIALIPVFAMIVLMLIGIIVITPQLVRDIIELAQREIARWR